MALTLAGDLYPLQGVRGVIEQLHRLYSRPRLTGRTLMGEALDDLFPVLQVKGRLLRGLPVKDYRFHVITLLPATCNILAVDASMKTAFDCGSFKVVVVKVAAAIWSGKSRIHRFEPLKRFALVRSKLEVEELMMSMELEVALTASDRLRTGDLCVLDRALMAIPALKSSTKTLLEELDFKLNTRGVSLLGVSKSSKMELNNGEPLIGHLLHRANRILNSCPWYYYPIFKELQYPSWYVGIPVVAKLDGESSYAFRVDVSRRSLRRSGLEVCLGMLASLQDPSTPGYPYPLRGVHEDAKIGRNELGMDRMVFLEALKEAGILSRFLADLKATGFKEEGLWCKRG
ncbi:MAG: DNA double-strand break repair nuclease NurA [Candidatus Nezhaarchaeales archaeon]